MSSNQSDSMSLFLDAFLNIPSKSRVLTNSWSAIRIFQTNLWKMSYWFCFQTTIINTLVWMFKTTIENILWCQNHLETQILNIYCNQSPTNTSKTNFDSSVEVPIVNVMIQMFKTSINNILFCQSHFWNANAKIHHNTSLHKDFPLCCEFCFVYFWDKSKLKILKTY